MKSAYLHLLQYFINHGYSLEISDGDYLHVACSYSQAADIVKAIDEADIRIIYKGDCMGTATVMTRQSPCETVTAYDDSELFDIWQSCYDNDQKVSKNTSGNQNKVLTPHTAIVGGKTTGLAGCNLTDQCDRNCLRKDSLLERVNVSHNAKACRYFIHA